MAADDELSSSQRCSLIKLNIFIALERLLNLEGIVNDLFVGFHSIHARAYGVKIKRCTKCECLRDPTCSVYVCMV